MAKFIKRIGTKTYKFATEIHLERVNMEVPVASRILITFKRGPHKVESKSFPAIENGTAVFDETLLMNSTLYYDKKQGTYLSKEATLVVFTVSVKGSKVAGHVKFDLAELPNLNLRERRYVWSLADCLDSKATIQVTVRNLQTEELSGRHVDSDEEHKSAVQATNQFLSPNREQHRQVHSRSPGSNGVLNDSQSNSLKESNSSSEKNQKDHKFLHSTPQKDNNLHEPHKQVYSSDTQSDVRSHPDETHTKMMTTSTKATHDIPKEHLAHSEIKPSGVKHENPVFASQIKKEIADSLPVNRLGEFELKSKNIEREKRDLLQKMQGLDFEVINAKITTLQKENAILAKKKKDLETKLQNTDLKEYERKIAEYERMIALLKEERNALDKGDRPSVLEFEKLKRNLTETEFMINYLKNEKQQTETIMLGKINELQAENDKLKFEIEKLSKQATDGKALLEDREKENAALREENNKLKAESLTLKGSRSKNVDAVKKALLDAQKTISTLSEEKEHSEKVLRGIIEQLRRENSSYKSQIEGLNSINIETLKKNSKESETVLERLRRENEGLQKKFEEQITNLIKEKQELEVFLRDTQTEDTHQVSFDSVGFATENYKKNEGYQEDIDKLRQKIRNLEIQNWNLMKEKEDALRKSREFEGQLSTFQQKIESLERQQGQKAVSSEMPDKEKQDIERRIIQEKIELESKVQVLTYERDELNKTMKSQFQSITREKEEIREQLEDVKRQLDDKSKQLDSVTAELEKKTQELESERKRASKTDNVQVKELKEKLKEKEKELKSKWSSGNDREGDQKHKIEAYIEKINELNNEIEVVNGQNQALMSQLETLKSQNDELQHQKVDMLKENQELQNELEHLKMLIQSLETQIGQLKLSQNSTDAKSEQTRDSEGSLEALKKENKSLKAKLESKSNEIEELKEEVEKLNQELEQSVEKLKKENKNLKAKLETKSKEIEELQEEIEQLNQDAEERTKKSGRKSQKKVKNAKAAESSEEEESGSDEGNSSYDLKHENSLLRMENETLKGLYEKVMKSSRNEGAANEKPDESEKIAELMAKLQKAEEQVTNLEKELETLRAQSEEFERIKTENETLKSKLEQAETQITDLTTQITSLEGTISKKEQDIASLQEENHELAQLKEQLESYQSKIEELNREKQLLTEKIDGLNQNIGEFEAQEEEYGKRLRLIDAAKAKLENQYIKLQDDYNIVKGEWMESEAQNLKLKTNIRMMEENEKALNEKLGKLSKELVEAKTDLGEVVNTVFELGSADVIDAIESRVLNKGAE